MRAVRKAVVVVLIVGCAAGLVWMAQAKPASDRLVGNANVLGAVAGLAALDLGRVGRGRHTKALGRAAGVRERETCRHTSGRDPEPAAVR